MAAPKPKPLVYRGRIDRVTHNRVSGWAMIDGQDDPATLEVLQQGELLGHITADQFRADLEQAGLGDGKIAFTFFAPESVSLDPAEVRVCFAGTDVALRPPHTVGGGADPMGRIVADVSDLAASMKLLVTVTVPELERAQTTALASLAAELEARRSTLEDLRTTAADVSSAVNYLSLKFSDQVKQTIREETALTGDAVARRLTQRFVQLMVLALLIGAGVGAGLVWVLAAR
jgi:hypothetical protein